MSNLVGSFYSRGRGQDLIEYVLLASFIAAGVVAGATLLGTNLNGWYEARHLDVDAKGQVHLSRRW